jgi:hypothetical protein
VCRVGDVLRWKHLAIDADSPAGDVHGGSVVLVE